VFSGVKLARLGRGLERGLCLHQEVVVALRGCSLKFAGPQSTTSEKKGLVSS
jgi:hypothetical protein